REGAARWGVRAATGAYTPSVSVSASWSGFTQKLSDINPTIAAAQANAAANIAECQFENDSVFARLNPPLTARNCSNLFAFTPQQAQAIRDQNAAYPFNFTPQPFQARLTVSIPLWGNFSQPLQVSQAKAQQQDLEESVRARGLQVHTEVSQAYLTVTTAYRTIAIQDKNRPAARAHTQLAPARDRVAAVTARGKIQPKKKVDISADITGRITRIAVREGDLVTKGQFLLQIDPTIYQANLQQSEAVLASSQAAAVQAKANRDQADRALGRTKDLHTQNPNLVSQEQLEQAQTAF